MNKKTAAFALSFLFFFLFISSTLQVKSQGIINRCGGSFGSNCFPTYSKAKPELIYRIDRNGLGDFSQEEARAIVEETLEQWNDVESSNFEFKADDNVFIDNDINRQNFLQFFDGNINPRQKFGFTPIVFDSDGSITAFLGFDPDSILGFAGATFVKGNTITESQAFFNGSLFESANRGISKVRIQDELEATILHELLHAAGGDHTPTLQTEALNRGSVTVLPGLPFNVEEFLPVMFPFSLTDEVKIRPDDVATISLMYPKASFDQDFATITGRALNSNNRALLGMEVTAFDLADPLRNAISSATGIFDNRGTFIIKGLKPGDYALRIERINENFVAGSSVGFHRPNTSSKKVGFFNGNGKDLVDSINDVDDGILTVAAGQEVSDVVIGGLVVDDDPPVINDIDDDSSNELEEERLDVASSILVDKPKRNSLLLVVKVPKNIVGAVKARIDTDPSLGDFVKIKKPVVKSKANKDFVKFKVRVRNAITDLFGAAGAIDIPLTVTDLKTGEDDTFIVTVSN